jgi:hypothetical protein
VRAPSAASTSDVRRRGLRHARLWVAARPWIGARLWVAARLWIGARLWVAARLWIVLVVAWAVFLTGLAYLAHVRDPATDNEQTTIGQALPSLDAALGVMASAVSSMPGDVRPLVALGGYLPIDLRCPITPIRSGTRYQRVLDLYLRPAAGQTAEQAAEQTAERTAERTALTAIASHLPAAYGAAVTRSDPPTLTAGAANFVTVRGTVPDPGHIRISADTGCRAAEGVLSVLAPLTGSQDRAPIARLLGAGPTLAGASDAGGVAWRGYRIDCPGREPLSTVQAEVVASQVRTPGLPPAPTGALAYSGPDGYVYRDGDAAIVVRGGSDRLTVRATVGCGT